MSFLLTCLFISLATFLGPYLVFVEYLRISDTLLGTWILKNYSNLTYIIYGTHRKNLKYYLLECKILEVYCHLQRPSLSQDDKHKMYSQETAVYYNLNLIQWEMNFFKGQVLCSSYVFSYTCGLNFQNKNHYFLPRLYNNKLLTDFCGPSLIPHPSILHTDATLMFLKCKSKILLA